MDSSFCKLFEADQSDFISLREFSNRVIMVTGAAGSIGSERCRQVLEYEPAALLDLLCVAE